MRQAAEAIAAQAAGRPCLVVASRVPQVMWYSGCEAVTFDLDEVRLPRRQGKITFLLLIGGDRRQPEGDLLAAYRDAAGDPMLVIEGRRPAEVYLLRGPGGGLLSGPFPVWSCSRRRRLYNQCPGFQPEFPVTGADLSACVARGRGPALLEVP